MDQPTVSAAAAEPHILVLGGKSFLVAPPTPGDMLRVSERMRALAQEKCISPVDYAAKHTHLPPAAFAVLMQEAIKLGSGSGVPGGGIKPTESAVWDEYATLAGVRWRVYYHVSQKHPDFTLETATALVTDDNLFVVADALDRALRLGDIDAKKKTPEAETGANS